MSSTRRRFLQASAAAGLAAWALPSARALGTEPSGEGMAYGLVTYQWAKDWSLPTLIANCEKAGLAGVELRTTHAHQVEPDLNDAQRAEVQRRFADSSVTLVGIGSNERFDNPDPEVVKKAIEATKKFIRLSHDVGGTGVKVKPDRFHPSVPREKTIQQIGEALNELGEYATGFGQKIRLEVHGQCAELPTIRAILDVATDPNVVVCWNSNPQDLQGEGLEHNFNLVKDRLGRVIHVRPLDSPDYPYKQLLDLLVANAYQGYVMLESGQVPQDPVAELARQQKLFQKMVADSERRLK